KAFDSVSHSHIIAVLKQKGVDVQIINLIGDLYNNIFTSIKMKNGYTEAIGIKSGVKQGDPMSPILFNLCIYPLLCKLENSPKGFQVGNTKISTMAFADDLVLLSNLWEGMEDNLKILEEFCHLTGLKINVQK
ncbi:PO21 protein, partial [Bucco capensis]|nr:PO21 protein [Bucco capensis]